MSLDSMDVIGGLVILTVLMVLGAIVYLAVLSYQREAHCKAPQTLTVCQQEYLYPMFVGKVTILQVGYLDVSCHDRHDREIEKTVCTDI